jgi:hypothetical protein
LKKYNWFQRYPRFVPTLADTNPFKDNPNAVLNIDTKVGGKLKNISIPKLEISGIGSTKVNASGRITGLPDVDKAVFDLVINQFETTAKTSTLCTKNTLLTRFSYL